MTCNPFTNVASKYSSTVSTPNNIQIKNFQDVIDYELDSTKRYDTEKLNTVVSGLNVLLRRTDISNLTTLNEKIKQSPINRVDVAEFLDTSGRNIDNVISTINNEIDRRKELSGEADVVRGTLGDFNLVSYPKENGTGIYDKVPSYVENSNSDGNGATFNVVIGNNGQPLISVADAGQEYNRGDIIVIEDLNIVVSVTETINLVSPNPPPPYPIPTFATQPFIPISTFDGSNPFPDSTQYPYGFFPAVPFIDLLNSFDNFLNDSYGSSIASGSCGKFNLSILSKLFELFGSIGQFKAQITSLIGDVWNGAKEFITSLPSLLNGLKNSFMKIIDNIVNQAKRTIEGFKSFFGNAGTAFQALAKEYANLVNFFSKDNIQKVKNVTSSIMQNMTDQFENPVLAIIEWILTRLCQLSDFISNFLNAPIKSFGDLINRIKITTNSLANLSNISIAGAAAAGAVRVPYSEIQLQAVAAAQRSNSASGSFANPTGSSPGRIAALPITPEDLAAVQQNVTASGWPGYFGFTSRVTNNNEDVDGSYLEGAGWKVVVRDNPLLFAKIKNVIAEVGGGPYTITSAFRSEKYNSRQKGAAKNSAHSEALALDIIMSQQQAIRFVPIASGNGFNGISYYPGNGFLHVDLRRRDAPGARSWTADQLSGELRNVINNHQNKLYNR